MFNIILTHSLLQILNLYTNSEAPFKYGDQ